MPTNRRRLAALACSPCALLLFAGSARAQATESSTDPLPAAVAPEPARDRPSIEAPAKPSHGDAAPAFRDLFRPFVGDLKRLGASNSVTFATIGAGAAATLHRWDRPVAGSNWGAGDMQEFLEPGRLVGSFVFQTGAAVATYAAGRFTKQARVATLGAELFRAQLLSQAVTQAIKGSTGRTRPDGTRLSFPSGHSASSFATASVLQRELGWKVGLPAYAVATWVAASRVQMHRHFVSDVVAGATLGILAGRAVTVGRGSGRFAIEPSFVSGGVGINLVKVPAGR